MRHDLKALIKDELVKRFEDVVKEEIRQHNLSIQKTDREISYLENLFEEHKKLLTLLTSNNNRAYLDIKEEFQKAKKKLADDHSRQDKNLAEKGKELDKLCSYIEKQASRFVLDEIFQELKNRMEQELNSIRKEMEKNNEAQSKATFELYSKHAAKMREEYAHEKAKISTLEKNMHKFSEKLDMNVVDAEGVNRSLKVEHKAIFVIEKKIENIYTLIQRLKKRMEK